MILIGVQNRINPAGLAASHKDDTAVTHRQEPGVRHPCRKKSDFESRRQLNTIQMNSLHLTGSMAGSERGE